MPSAARPAGLPAWGGRYAQRMTFETLARWGPVCHLCRQAAPAADTADHLTPRSNGGSDDVERNLRPAHRSCNTARGTMPLTEWFASHPVPHRPALTPSARWR